MQQSNSKVEIIHCNDQNKRKVFLPFLELRKIGNAFMQIPNATKIYTNTRNFVPITKICLQKQKS